MIRIGEYCRLKAARTTDFGFYMTDGTDEVLLPRKLVPEGLEIGEVLRVFVSTDSEDRPVATTQKPAGVVGAFVLLKAKQITQVGAFMDWGLDKDLLVPFGEQHRPIEEGKHYVVHILRDERTNRVFGTTKLGKYLKSDASVLKEGMEVKAMAVEQVAQGYRFIVDETFFGMLFQDEVHERIRLGETRTAYVKRVREDGGLAITLVAQGFYAALDQGPAILGKLRANAEGMLPYGDKTPPDDIRKAFGMSKATFKKAIGNLMRQGVIDIEDYSIRLKAVPTKPKPRHPKPR